MARETLPDRVMAALFTCRRATAAELAARVYPGEPPLNAEKFVRQAVAAQRLALRRAAAPYRIEGRKGHGGGYRLVWTGARRRAAGMETGDG